MESEKMTLMKRIHRRWARIRRWRRTYGQE